ncbi:hypothetical protein [Paraburkholderia sp. BL21I4N1]|uniref:hypothetical protein n=1 Tax=Paraburkholderia sp. BL21I4N1 TaxID=1938801 RepID=UPI002157D9BF|nr:hypothetical protein [Paraburkholderia sp. BL21I4N1]
MPNPSVSPTGGFAAAGEAHGGPALAVAPPRFGRLAMGVATAGALALGVMGTVAYGVWFNHDQQAYAEAMAGARQALGASAPVGGGVGGAAGMAGTVTATAAAAKTAAANIAAANVANAAPTTPAAPTPTTLAPTAADTSSDARAEQGGRLASWTGQVARPSAPDPELARGTDATDTPPTASPSSLASTRRSPGATDSPTPQLVAARPAKDPRSVDARAASPSERHAANTRHKSLFARMGQFFHRVSYRQHGNASQQDIYSHP